MKKLLFAFLLCTWYFIPGTAFGQSKTYFHDRIDTTIYATTTGTNAYTGTNTDPNFNVAAYMRGLMVSTFIVNGNTGACTYRLVTRTGALSAVAIKKQNGAALVAGDIPDSTAVLLLYYGSFWRLEGIYTTATSAWSLTGNAGTTAGTNFLGTTDAIDLVFKTNNTEKARVSSAGVFSLGLASTNNGSLLFRNSTNANTLTINSGVTSSSHSWTLPLAQGAANTALANNGSGVLSWSSASGIGGWDILGNAGTVAGTNFVGTTDNIALAFKTNGTEAGRISTGQLWAIGPSTLTPLARMHIQGTGATAATYGLQVHNSTGTSNTLMVQDNAMVGIATAIPTSPLHVTGGASSPFVKITGTGTYANLTFQNATTGSGALDGLETGTGATANGDMGYLLQYENLPIGFWTNGTEKMRLTAAGNLAIGNQVGGASVDISKAGANLNILNTTNSGDGDLYIGADNAADVSKYFNLRFNGDAATNGALYFIPNSLVTANAVLTITTGGLVQLAENTSIDLNEALSADGKYTGTTITGTAGTTLAFGDVIYLAAADSRWELADADAASTAGDVLVGMCVLAAAADGSPTTILLNGTVRADAAFPAFTVSAPIFISTTAGDVTQTAPAGSADVVRRLGFAITADEMYFNPSNDYITIP